MIGPNSSPLYRPPNPTNSHEEKTGLPPPPTSSISCLKPADRRKTYLKTPPDSVSILSTREEVPRAHRVEVESCAPNTIDWCNRFQHFFLIYFQKKSKHYANGNHQHKTYMMVMTQSWRLKYTMRKKILRVRNGWISQV